MRDLYSVTELCEALAVSPSGYHAARRRPASARSQANATLLGEIERIHAHRHTRVYGSPRMTVELRAQGRQCARHRVARLMRREGVRARPRQSFRPRTTCADHAAYPSPNLLAKAAAPTVPGRQVVTDITYLPTREGWLYLSVAVDLFSRSVLGWQTSTSLHAQLVVDTIDKTLASGLVAPDALFHSDRGCQYTGEAVRARLARAHLLQSMSAKGCCYDNAFAESFFASLKAEALPADGCFDSRLQAERAIFDYIETFYNRSRRHSSLGQISPRDFLHRHFQNQKPNLN